MIIEHKSIEKAKKIICTIVKYFYIKYPGDKSVEKNILDRIFYYSHLYHYQYETGVLSMYPIIHTPDGPGIYNRDELLSELKKDGIIDIKDNICILINDIKQNYLDSEEEIKSIRVAIKYSRSPIFQFISRSWELTEDGEEMSIYLDLLNSYEYYTMKERQKTIGLIVDKVFGEINDKTN